MKRLDWFERSFNFGLPTGMFPFYLERLEGVIARLEKKVQGQTNALLSTRFHDKWSIKQNIGHLAEVSQISTKRIAEMCSGADTLSPAVFEPQDYNPWPIERVLTFFEGARHETLLAFHALDEHQLHAASMHPRLKVLMTPVDLAFFDAEHDDHHLLKISDILTTHS